MTVRAVAVGIPDRLKDDLATLDGVVLAPDLVTAAGVLDDWPDAHVIYGEELFGAAVTGQPVFLLPAGQDVSDRVWVLMDAHPLKLDELAWDDPRRLGPQAGVRLRAGHLVDTSEPTALAQLDVLLNRDVDTPNVGGYPEDNDGND